MRIFLGLMLLAGVSRIASAHTLGNEDGELLGLHHLPLTVLLIVAGIMVLRNWRKARRL
jgi:predicted transporter